MRTIALAVLALAHAEAQDAKNGTAGEVREETWKEGTIVKLRVPVSTDSHHVMTAVTFPEESIEGLVQGWNESDISLDHKRGTLYVKLLKPADGHLYVVGGSKTKYTLFITSVDSQKPYDAEVRLEREKPAGDPKSAATGHTGKPIGSIELVRAMRLGVVPENGTVKKGDGRPVFKTERLQATLAWKYETLSYSGYILDVTNTSSIAIALDLSRFSAPGLVLVGAREMTVEAGAGTRLYLVFWKE